MKNAMPPLEGEILPPGKTARDEQVVREGFWRKLRRALGRIPFSEDLVAAYYCASDPATPLAARAVMFGALAYFVMPFDAIPDVVAVIGFTDDAAVLAAAIATAGANIKSAHREAARRILLSERRPG